MRGIPFLICLGVFSLAAVAFAGEKPLEARAKLSYRGTGGNTKTHGAAVSGEADYAYRRLAVDGGGNYAFSSSAGKKTAENGELFAGAKLFLGAGEKLYARYKADWRSNVFSGFEHRFYNFGGLGVYVIRSDPQELSVESGLSYVHERYAEDVPERSAAFAAAHVGADYRAFLNGISEVDVSLAWDVDLQDAADQLLSANAAWNVFAAGWFALSVEEKVDWDNVPPRGYGRLDVTTTVGLAIRNY